MAHSHNRLLRQYLGNNKPMKLAAICGRLPLGLVAGVRLAEKSSGQSA